MPIHMRENQYQGVNAHLHSYFQQHGDWEMFHGAHIQHLREALQELLPPGSGYLAVGERSLQIRRYDLLEDRVTYSRIKPDISVYQAQPKLTGVSGTAAFTPTLILPIAATIEEPEYLTSIVIYEAIDDVTLGKPVTRIELLSPANKPPGSHHQQYITKRDETLLGGISIVEMDYLHERRFPISALPSYPDREAGAYPYMVVISNPSPSINEGKARVFGFRVDDPIPAVSIPLHGSDTVTFDLREVYNHTFAADYVYGLHLVDYADSPERLDTYDEVDQQRIAERMRLVAQKHGGL